MAGWADDRPVWTGSCPCQPFSAAGKGTAFDDERHLWPAWHWLIQECRPPVVFGEQVASKDAEPWLDLVSTDLEAMAFAVAACAFPSASIGAPHIRDRTYFVAYASGAGLERSAAGTVGRQRAAAERGSSTGRLAHPDVVAGRQGREVDGGRHPGSDARPRAGSGCDGVPVKLGNAEGERCGEAREPRPGHSERSADASAACRMGDALDQPRERDAGGISGTQAPEHGAWVSIDGSQPVRPEHAGASVAPGAGPVNGFWGAADWLLCRDGKWRPVEPGTFPLAHGAPARVGRLRAYGNAINAQQAQIFIEESMRCI
ncbi:DNA cytosine methyltransferase [Achromobacter xylosoxidans]|nr:DNA cytosine methyltransferase [Achromobacter xylosoxidans]MCZ8436839.1 DNA cytosine methyltransferase [Achromobacter xylosoxidans]